VSQPCTYVHEGQEGRRCYAWAVKGSDRCRHHAHGAEQKSPKEPSTLLERVVWDALKNSRCPRRHRYQGPGKSLPCRWCRTAHAITLTLIEIEAAKTTVQEVLADFKKQLGWDLADPVVSPEGEAVDRGCSVCQRKPGEPRTSWCSACR
jgi:hypothetical protein